MTHFSNHKLIVPPITEKETKQMLASQLIYTSWKNGDSPNKGYMVYSKSEDITAEESTEIQNVLIYNAPPDLPYTPTKEQIDTLFPKNFAFFKLSSGRYCIGQSAYIGQDYTGRWGNYIIHAYVVDSIENAIPANLIGKDCFRLCLTEEELNAPSAPSSLPKVELELVGTAITQAELDAFFDTEEKKQLLRYLVQTVIDTVPKSGHIHFYETTENLAFWLKAISLVVPRDMLSSLYFSTYTVNPSDLVTFSCMLPGGNSGFYTFDNSLVTVHASQGCEDIARDYVKAACKRLLSELPSGILFANDVNALMKKYSLSDCDRATKLIALQKGYEFNVTDLKELNDLISSIAAKDAEHLPAACENVYSLLCIKAELAQQNGIFESYKLIYPNLSATSKEKLIVAYVEKMLNASAGRAPEELYNSIRSGCPCNWSDAVRILNKGSISEQFIARGDVCSEMLVIFTWFDAYPLLKEDIQAEIIEKIKQYYKKYASQNNAVCVTSILKRCQAISTSVHGSVYKCLAETDMSFFAKDISYLFRYLSFEAAHEGLFWSVLNAFFKKYPDLTNSCMVAYERFLSEHQNEAAKLDNFAARTPELKDFSNNVRLYRFEQKPYSSAAEFSDAYKNFVLADYGESALNAKAYQTFLSKLRAYLSSSDNAKKMTEGMKLYTSFASNAQTDENERNILSILFDAIVGEKTFSEISKFFANNRNAEILLNDAAKYGFSEELRAKLSLYLEGMAFSYAASSKDRNATERIVKLSEENELLYASGNVSRSLISEFAGEYLDVILRTVYKLYDASAEKNFNSLLVTYLQPLYRNVSELPKIAVNALKKDINITNSYMRQYFEFALTGGTEFSEYFRGNILKDYLSALSAGKRKEIFVSVSKSIENSIAATDKNSVHTSNNAKTEQPKQAHETDADKNKTAPVNDSQASAPRTPEQIRLSEFKSAFDSYVEAFNDEHTGPLAKLFKSLFSPKKNK